MSSRDYSQIKGFDDFRALASDKALSKYEKIGFPDSFREGRENDIFQDILYKLPLLLSETEKVVLDIGPGCTDIPRMLTDLCAQRQHSLILADSEEMLALLPDAHFVTKIPGFFPASRSSITKHFARVDVIVCYSVFHYIFADTDYAAFVDACIDLLNDGGQILLGDIPNLDKRNRFFSSDNGVRFHQSYMNTDTLPPITKNSPALNAIDDSVLDKIVAISRSRGCDAYIVPQPSILPMSNRRDDVIIRKP